VGSTGATGSIGPQGPIGPKGGGLYTTRNDVYCNKALTSDALGVLRVSCSAPADLPLSGGCFSVDDRVAVVLRSEQDGWEGVSSTIAAGWRCEFGKNGILLSTPFAGAAATICCVKSP
jgi:hypothetical protein